MVLSDLQSSWVKYLKMNSAEFDKEAEAAFFSYWEELHSLISNDPQQAWFEIKVIASQLETERQREGLAEDPFGTLLRTLKEDVIGFFDETDYAILHELIEYVDLNQVAPSLQDWMKAIDMVTRLGSVAPTSDRANQDQSHSDKYIDVLNLRSAWISMSKLEGKEIPDALFVYWEELNDLARHEPEKAWLEIKAIASELETEKQLAYLAAGPLEDMLVAHGPKMIEIFKGDDFDMLRLLLPYVWTSGMDQETAEWVAKTRPFAD